MPTRPLKCTSPEMITIALPLVWVGADEADIVFINGIAVQPQGDEVIILLGQQAPPLLLGTPAQMAEQAKRLISVPVKTRLRIGLTRQRLAEFAEVMQRAVVVMEQQAGALRQKEAEDALAAKRERPARRTVKVAPKRKGK